MRVVIVGGGFGGLACARQLVKEAGDSPVDVTLVDARNHHTFQPLLYQVATAGLQPQDVGQPLRPIFGDWPSLLGRVRGRRGRRVDVRLGHVVGLNDERDAVRLADGDELGFDHLVVAAGAVSADFGVPGVEEHAFGLKSLPESLALRDHVLLAFEEAAAASQSGAQVDEGALTFVVVGGGPTGVETAGALAELVDHVLRRDHPHLDLSRVRIVLLEMQDRLLPAMSEHAGREAERKLRARGVEVRLGTAVTEAREGEVELDDGEVVAADTLVWVAGVKAAPLASQLGADTEGGGRVPVDAQLRLDEAISVIGDAAHALDDEGEPLPQLAPVALQQGEYVADRILADLRGEPSDGFSYFDKGTMATIGRRDAVADLPLGLRLRGTLAWLAWLGLHLLFLLGFRNRVAVLLSWMWNYITYDRSARLVLGPGRPHAARVGDAAPGGEAAPGEQAGHGAERDGGEESAGQRTDDPPRTEADPGHHEPDTHDPADDESGAA